MPRYEVLIIDRPESWQPAGPDDVPPDPGRPREVLDEFDNLFAAVGAAIRYNRGAPVAGRWAVVADPSSAGQVWPNARLCTPVTYQVRTFWWPEGWEPYSPLDVPNCVLTTQREAGGAGFTYQQAVGIVRALNQQCIEQAAAVWYAVTAVENEPLRRTATDAPSRLAGPVEVRRHHVVRPEAGGGRGDCSHCPAHALPCAAGDGISSWEPAEPSG